MKVLFFCILLLFSGVLGKLKAQQQNKNPQITLFKKPHKPHTQQPRLTDPKKLTSSKTPVIERKPTVHNEFERLSDEEKKKKLSSNSRPFIAPKRKPGPPLGH